MGALVLMLTNLLLLLPAASVVCGNIDQGLLEAADGEIAMKNLEAAQVKMEEKLSSLTSFIDQELEKEKDSPMSKGYARRKRETKESNPLLDLPQNTVKEMIVSMKALNSAFDNLQKAYEEYKHNMAQDKEIIDESEIEPQVDPSAPAEDPAEYPSAPAEDPAEYPSAEDLEDYPSSPADNNEENSPASVDDNDQYPIPADDLPDDTAGEDEQAGQLEDEEPEGEMTNDVNENTEATADVEAPDATKEEENMNKNKKRNGKGKRRRKGKGKGKKGKGRRRF